MTDEDKIVLMDYIIRYMEDKVTSSEIPVMVGALNKSTGLTGFKMAEIGHPVFEFKDRYVIYLERNDGNVTVSVPYYKESLKPIIDFK
jgi:hypothetical protein